MNEDEIKKAIERGKLPLNIFDIMSLVLSGLFVILIIYIVIAPCLSNSNAQNISQILLAISLAVLIACNMWNIFHSKKIFANLSVLSNERKKMIIENLVSQQDIAYSNDNSNSNYYRFSVGGGRTLSFNVIVFFDEYGYYINSTENMNRIQLLSTYKMNDIIRRIKKIESEL